MHLPTNDFFIGWHPRVLDNRFYVGKLIPDAPDLVQLLLILHHQDAALAVLQNILASLCTIGGVYTSRKTPGKYSRKV